MGKKRILNVVSGEVMYHSFMEGEFEYEGIVLPFNEAMCQGDVLREIFSEDFIKVRYKEHRVAKELYEDITLKPMNDFFYREYEKVVMWFDDDMFCQMNMLTLFAFLEQRKFKGEVVLKLVNHMDNRWTSHDVELGEYTSIYNELMVERTYNEDIEDETLRKAAELYLSYKDEDGEISRYIKESTLPQQTLIKELVRIFTREKNYGLGNTQYMRMIEDLRGC